MKFNKLYETFMESTEKTFKVKINKLYSPNYKLDKTVEELNNKKFSHNKGKPITVSKFGKGRYFIIDGNHRALEDYLDGKTTVDAVLDRYLPDITKGGQGYEAQRDAAVPVVGYADKVEKEIDESRIPKALPRYLYHATYKQMLPTLKKTGVKAGAFLSKSFKEAFKNAEMLENIDQDWKDNIVVFKINTAKLDPNRFAVDGEGKNNEEYTYEGAIPYDVLVKNG